MGLSDFLMTERTSGKSPVCRVLQPYRGKAARYGTHSALRITELGAFTGVPRLRGGQRLGGN